MPRVARIVVPGIPHHITQRGNNRQDVFFFDDDRQDYLDLLKKYCQQNSVTIWAYCLMTNHVHLVVTPEDSDGLAKAVGRTNFRYAQALNQRRKWSGHLWQNRFASCALDELHFWRAVRYVERNPVRAGMVRVPWRYPWSSAAAHVEGVDPTGLLDLAVWKKEWRPRRWREALRDPDDECRERLCACTRTGRPLGSDQFVVRMERKLDREIRVRPIGRPRKARNRNG